MKKYTLIKNPLTVISIFASLTEIVCGSVTPFVSDVDNQKLFLIFVIGFPILLVTLFFITLNFNHKVLYAPSDFNETDNNIAQLFYGKTKDNAIIQSPNKILIKENSLKNLNLSDLDEDSRPHFVFALKFYSAVEKLLPLDKIEEINFDSENNIVHTLEIRIKSEFLKENEKQREVFVLLVHHDYKYDEETHEYSNEKFTTGFIAGSGQGNTKEEKAETVAIYIVQTISERLK